jgi:hypothetical protein
MTTAFMIQKPETIAMSYLVSMMYILSRQQVSKKHFLIWSMVSLIFSLAALTKDFGFTPFFYVIGAPILILAARQLASRPLNSVLTALGLFYWIFATAVFFGILINSGNPAPLEGLIPGTSTNGIPSYLIVVQIAYSLLFFMSYKRLPILSAIATFVVAIYGLGRGSMIVGALIFSFSIFINFANSKLDRNVAIFITIFFILPFILFYLDVNHDSFFFITQDLIDGSKFKGGVIDEHRVNMIADYLNKIDLWSFILGTDYTGTSIEKFYGGNPHNSYLRAHSFYGLAGLICIFIPIILVIGSSRLKVEKIITLILIFFALLRATTEPIFFPSVLDFFYIFYFFTFFRFATKLKQVNHAA